MARGWHGAGLTCGPLLSALPPAPEAAPGCAASMADPSRDAALKQAPNSRNEKVPTDFGYVGIDSILEQMRRKAMKQGFEFNIMVVGESRPAQPQAHRPPGGSSGQWPCVRGAWEEAPAPASSRRLLH